MHRSITECGIILLNKTLESVLVIFQKESLKWGLPKGHMEPYELKYKLYFDCARRELLEETGIMISTHKYKQYGTLLLGNKLFYVLQLMRDVYPRKPLDSTEIGNVKWLPIKNIGLFLKRYNCNVTLRDFSKRLTTTC
jgi:8-oxo-dGTP pyrophosphatase MutT (NUDIX family)